MTLVLGATAVAKFHGNSLSAALNAWGGKICAVRPKSPSISTRNSVIADKPRDAFAQYAWRGLPPKTRRSPYVLPRRTWSWKGVNISRRELQNWGTLGSAPLEWETWLSLGNTLHPHTCYLAERCRSVLKGVGINRGESQNWEALTLRSLGMGGVDDSQQTAPPHVLPCRTWSFCVKR